MDPSTTKFIYRGSLPFEPELLSEQPQLLRHVMEQTYSKEILLTMLNLQKQQKQRCSSLEEQLVNMIIGAMQLSELADTNSNASMGCDEQKFCPIEWFWLHISSQLIYFVLFQFVSFMHITISLYEKVHYHKLINRFIGLLVYWF